MRVLTYNIYGWRGTNGGILHTLQDLAAVIGDSGADVIGLNEVFHPLETEAGAALAWLAQRLAMHFAFGPALAAAESPLGIAYGNALLSRWPIIAYAAHRLSAGTDGERRCLFEARVAVPGVPLTLYVTHLDHRSEALRLEQWSAASTWLMRDRAKPHLLLGDFNTLAASDYPSAAALDALRARREALGWPPPAFDLTDRVLKAGYVDAYARAGVAPAPTFPASAPEIRIDYVFLPEIWANALVSCRRWDHPLVPVASDHVPVLVELT